MSTNKVKIETGEIPEGVWVLVWFNGGGHVFQCVKMNGRLLWNDAGDAADYEQPDRPVFGWIALDSLRIEAE